MRALVTVTVPDLVRALGRLVADDAGAKADPGDGRDGLPLAQGAGPGARRSAPIRRGGGSGSGSTDEAEGVGR